ncbi:MAG: heparinase II/III family protein [Proteobacteria bacterium]|nr:heparinase II/III family protein [Pseudomonadota bacterium]
MSLFSVPPINDQHCQKLKIPDLLLSDMAIAYRENTNNKLLLDINKEQIQNFEDKNKTVFFANIHTGENDPDLRTVWEQSRLQNITYLIASTLSEKNDANDQSIKKIVRNKLSKWINGNPYLLGPHYISSMECGLRVPVFLYCLKYLDQLDSADRKIILDAIYTHGWWISHHLSLYSSIGNHTVCEALGLVFAGVVYRETSTGTAWLAKGIDLLQQELNHQIIVDGGPAEQSINYHRFVLDLYWLSINFLESNGLSDCSVWKPRLLLGEAFIAAFQDENGNLPSIGDSDDGHAIAPKVKPKRGIPAIQDKRCITFSDSGYTVIRTQSGIMYTFDHGPLGMAPLYNHGHADALSVTLSMNGVPMLVDTGTYRYNGVPEWRKYFKGTRSHNTVTIDGQDQAVQETGFIWSHPYTCKLLRNDHENGIFIIEAQHDGYNRFKKRVLHKRLIYVTDSKILIRDKFSGKGPHRYELNYHLHPDCQVSRDGQWFKVAGNKGLVLLRLLDDKQFNMASGEENPPFGWYSPAYNVKIKSQVLSCRQEGTPDEVTFITAICTGEVVADDELKAIAVKL